MYEKCTIDIIHTFALAKIFNSDGSEQGPCVCGDGLSAVSGPDYEYHRLISEEPGVTGSELTFANCGSNGLDHGSVCNYYSLQAYTDSLAIVMSSDHAGWPHILAGITGYTYI